MLPVWLGAGWRKHLIVIPAQKGNRRQVTYFSDDDFRAYLDLMRCE